MTRIAVAVLLASCASAQTGGSIEEPVLGLVFDPEAAAIREITGIPGAARLGAALDSGVGIRLAALGSNRGYALVVGRNGAAMAVSRDAVRPLPGAGSGAARIAVSPLGTAAALYFADSRTCEIYTGMPENARLARSIPLPEHLDDLAVSDDGGVVLALSRGGRRGDLVYAHGTEGEPQIRYRARRISAIGFVPGSAKALVAEPDTVMVVAPDLGRQPAGSDPDGGISAVAASRDGSRVLFASQSGRVGIFDLRSSETTVLRCACAPNTFSGLHGDAVYRLNDAGEGPLWLLDAGATEPRIYFVAAGGLQ